MKFKFLNKVTNPNDDQSIPVLRGRFWHRLSSDPFMDWLIILVMAFIIAFALVGSGIYVYLETGNTLSSERPAPKGAAMPLNHDKLDAVLTKFSAQKAQKDAIIRAYEAPRDPSLP